MCISCLDMTKRTVKLRVFQFTSKVHKQHASLVITLPKGVCNQLEIRAGDIVLFEVEPGEVACIMGKITLRGIENGGNSRNSNRGNQSRGA